MTNSNISKSFSSAAAEIEMGSKKSVSFSEDEQQIDLQTIPSNQALTQEEYDAAWYSAKDLRDIMNHCRMVAKGEIQEEPIRGLELLVTSAESSMDTRKAAVCQVLLEQEKIRLLHDGKVDPDALAEVDRISSEHRQRIAHLRAIQDAEVASGSGFLGQEVHINPDEVRQRRRSRRSERRTSRISLARSE
jgi:hypothetical protein